MELPTCGRILRLCLRGLCQERQQLGCKEVEAGQQLAPLSHHLREREHIKLEVTMMVKRWNIRIAAKSIGRALSTLSERGSSMWRHSGQTGSSRSAEHATRLHNSSGPMKNVALYEDQLANLHTDPHERPSFQSVGRERLNGIGHKNQKTLTTRNATYRKQHLPHG